MPPRQNPPHLGPDLTPREAALDAIHRFIQGLDFNDPDLLRSAFTADAEMDFSDAATTQSGLRGIEAIVAAVRAKVGPMATAHHVSNARVRLADDGGSAVVTVLALAQHYPPGEGMGGPERRRYTMGNYYAVDVVRGEGELWRIRRFEMSTLWSDGDAGLLGDA